MHMNHLVGMNNSNLNTFFPSLITSKEKNNNSIQLAPPDFAMSCKKYFIQLYSHITANYIIENVNIFHNCTNFHDVYKSAVILSDLLSKNDLLNDDTLSKSQRDRREKLKRELTNFFLDLLQHKQMDHENYYYILESRKNQLILSIISQTIEDRSIDCSNLERLTSALLLSDVTNTQRITADKILEPKPEFSDSTMALLRSFQWQNEQSVKGITNLPPDWNNGEFVYAIDTGIKAILNDLWTDNISRACLSRKKPTNTCMSPNSFLDLLEKYFVWTQLLSKSMVDVLIPQILIKKVVCYKNSGYAKIIREYQTEPRTDKMKSTSRFCYQNLHYMTMSLLNILPRTNTQTISNWIQASKTARDNQNVDSTSVLHNFTTRVFVLFNVYLLNLRQESREKIWNSIRNTIKKCDLSIFSEELKRSFNRFDIGVKKFIEFSISYFQKIHSPMECVHWNTNNRELPNFARYTLQVHLRSFIVVDEKDFISILNVTDLPEITSENPSASRGGDSEVEHDLDFDREFTLQTLQVVAEPPIRLTFEQNIRKYSPFLKLLFSRTKIYLKKRGTPIGMTSRLIEKTLYENKINTESKLCQMCLTMICPVVLEYQKKLEEAEQKFNILKVFFDYLFL